MTVKYEPFEIVSNTLREEDQLQNKLESDRYNLLCQFANDCNFRNFSAQQTNFDDEKLLALEKKA